MATVPSMKTWVDGETVTPQDMNDQIRDVGDFLISGRPACRVSQRVTSQSVVTNTFTPIVFDTEEYDTDGMFDPVSSDQITVQTSGLYLVSGTVAFAPNGTGIRVVNITSSSRGSRTDLAINAVGGNVASLNVSTVDFFSAGEVVDLRCYQSSGGNLDTWATTSYNHSSLSAVWLGS